MEEKEVVIIADPYKKPIRALFIFSTLFSIVSILYFLFPIVSTLIGVLCILIVLIIIVASAVFTLFTACASEDYRRWVGSTWNWATSLLDKNNKVINAILPYYAYANITALAFNLLVLVFSIIQRVRFKKGYLATIIVTSLFLICNIVMLVLYYVNGMQIVKV